MSRSDYGDAAYAIIAAELARLEREPAELARAKRDSHG